MARVVEAVLDKAKRREFLLGFSKRKQERRVAAKQSINKQRRKERAEAHKDFSKDMRHELKLQEHIDYINEQKMRMRFGDSSECKKEHHEDSPDDEDADQKPLASIKDPKGSVIKISSDFYGSPTSVKVTVKPLSLNLLA